MKNQINLACTLFALLMCATSLTNAQQSWLLTGNAGNAGDFLGTTSSDALIFKTNSTERMRIAPSTGFLGIGTTNPLFPLDLLNSTRTRSLNIKHAGVNLGSLNSAFYATTSNTGGGDTYGFYTDMPATSTGGGAQGAFFGKVSGSGPGSHYGIFTQLTGSGNGSQYGARISISNGGTGVHYGVYSAVTGSAAVSKFGVYSSASGGSNDYAYYGLGRSYFSDKVGIGVPQPSSKLHVSGSAEAKTVSFKNDYSGSGAKHGIYNEVTSLGGGSKYGMYNTVGGANTSGSESYGIYNNLNNPGSGTSYGISSTVTSGTASSSYGIYSKLNAGTGIAWGILSEGSNTSNADAYGIYATASSTGSGNSCYGVRGFANSSGSYGYGVYGKASGANTNIGVYGTVSAGTGNWAGWFDGLTYIEELRIGNTRATGYMVSVDGKIICEELRVENSDNWPDYVFDENYLLPSLEEVEQHIKDKKHLPGIPSAREIEENGLLVGEMQKKMMEKIEELTLYMIELKNENKQLRVEMDLLKSPK